MDKDKLEGIIKKLELKTNEIKKLESMTVECKTSWSKILDPICTLANKEGGIILVGVQMMEEY